MQLITFLSAATAMVATASADTVRTAAALNAECNPDQPHAKVINRCDYPVHIWSILKSSGAPTTNGMVTLQTGETYQEEYYENPKDNSGVSIKISKTEECETGSIVQLEYFLPQTGDFQFNYLDVSYIDCENDDCPTKQEGYYLVAGNQTGGAKASAGNTWCPILSCNDPVSCAKCSYMLPDDVQTKTCDQKSSMTFYMCGGEAPDQDYSSSPAPASSPNASNQAQSSVVASSSIVAPSSVGDGYLKAIVTPSPVPAADDSDYNHKTKTQVEVVYVTAYEYVNEKRHGHGHARRHQPFRA